MLSEKELPTAVVVANDLMALGAMQEFKAAGLHVPQDISIVGFHDISFASLAAPPLTTVCSPRLEIGRRAFEALMLTVVDRPHQQGVEVRVPTYLIQRESTGLRSRHRPPGQELRSSNSVVEILRQTLLFQGTDNIDFWEIDWAR
jgi:DNA-binding LacI/PurR family transcriptional regulator